MAAQAPLRRIFLAASLERLVALIIEQGDEALKHSKIEFPGRATPTILLLAKEGPMSAADIARRLKESHQLVTQRLDLLIEKKIATRVADPRDGRRKLLRITTKGYDQLKLLGVELRIVEQIWAQLFDEIGADLAQAALRAIDALEKKPLMARARALKSAGKPKKT
jgi:DNA-binding MarR family transcriptional regulator